MGNPIDQVRETLERWGWIQGWWDSDDGYCLIGAFEQVFGVSLRNIESEIDQLEVAFLLSPQRQTDLAEALHAVAVECNPNLADELPAWDTDVGSVTLWNDQGSMTWQDVALVLKRASAAMDEAIR